MAKATTILKLASENPSMLSDCELLVLVLETIGTKGDLEKLANDILSQHGSFASLCRAPLYLLESIDALGKTGAGVLKACLVSNYNFKNANNLSVRKSAFTIQRCEEILGPHFIGYDHEILYAVLVDRAARIIDIVKLSEGTEKDMLVDNKKIIDIITRHGSNGVILAHNHFAGSAPSLADVRFTAQMGKLLFELGVELCDHFIYYNGTFHSMKRHGEMHSFEKELISNANI